MNEKDLIVLMYADNNHYVEAKSLEYAIKKFGLKVNLERNSWTWEEWKNMRIGESRSYYDYNAGIIGVYDKNNIKHLDLMVHAATDAVSDYAHIIED